MSCTVWYLQESVFRRSLSKFWIFIRTSSSMSAVFLSALATAALGRCCFREVASADAQPLLFAATSESRAVAYPVLAAWDATLPAGFFVSFS